MPEIESGSRQDQHIEFQVYMGNGVLQFMLLSGNIHQFQEKVIGIIVHIFSTPIMMSTLVTPFLCPVQLGALAVFIRQTNIIWMLFVLCTKVINISLGHQRDSMKDDESIEKTNQINPKNSVIMSSNLRKRKSNGNADIHKRARPRAISVSMAPKPGFLLHG